MRSLAPPKCILGRGVQFINLNLLQKFQILTNWEKRCAFHDRNHQGHVRYQAHTIIAKIAKLLSHGLRPIFGGGVRNNCNTIRTSIVLRMVSMLAIVLARVLRST